MIVDGRAIAEDIYEGLKREVHALGRAPVLSIITCSPNFETKKYLELKRKKAAAIGIETALMELAVDCSTDDARRAAEGAASTADGVIVQLPFPSGVDIASVLAAVPTSCDVDALNPETTAVHSPVVAACEELLMRGGVAVKGTSAVVVGQGRLVGIPVAKWLEAEGACVTVYSEKSAVDTSVLQAADIIISGAGDPGFLKPDMIKEGVVIIDAGTSEEGGELRGDADPACAKKAALFTPVPGGVGPVTVAMLLKNVVKLAELH